MAADSSAPLRGQVAVVTGGASGLGLGFATVLGRAGASVVISALPDSGVPAAVAQLSAQGITAVGHEGNVADLASVEALRDLALQWGRLDIWINNAGAPGIYGPTHQIPPHVFDRVLDANVRGVFHGTRTAVAAMLERGSGHVVNVWGKGARKPVPWQNAYASSKAWNRSFTRTVRGELKGTGVRVHGFDPGLVKTEMLGEVTVAPGMEKRVQALPYVVGLWGQTPEQAAAPVLRLLIQDRDDHEDLTVPTVVTRGLRSALKGNLRRSKRIKMNVRTLDLTD
ncbi:SDR family NAD(P)-dependent oxidoreductase [Nocardioides jishulii]|uniref:SDR family oxidoreductase n=1 Tax=Nocardioides jishulii TaxID=2575440 RepID=A0A4U2YTX0_9ACTN|nr:SDR family oxidoreductase [Nocardioides jishulii]QCX28477.1 SDR family oxidoreductase [Nocardioides jishulii]TKI64630.1 SDR family oxidoreductase [Nocardioides jishulii]